MQMERALIFGGLSPCGFPLSEILLEKGLQVVSLSSALNEDEKSQEDDRELFLGRHSFFRIEKTISQEPFDYLFLADTIRTHVDESLRLKEQWKEMFSPYRLSGPKSLVFLSSLEICGGNAERLSEKEPVHPLTALGKIADEMEVCFVNERRRIRNVRAVIFRTDLKDFADRKKGRRIAELMSELAFADYRGLEVFHFIDERMEDPQSNRKIRSFLRGKVGWL